jgi:hypothetical protein
LLFRVFYIEQILASENSTTYGICIR